MSLILVFSAPSGTGKTTIIKSLLGADPELALSISTTTRDKRPSEENGQDYYFINHEQFKKIYSEDGFLESAKVFQHYYGTLKIEVERILKTKKDVILDIDWQGMQQVKAKVPEIISIFILPPSLKELRRRLNDRKQDTEDVINFRMEKAKSEIVHWKEYDYVIINDDLKITIDRIQSIILAERLKRKENLKKFVQELE